MNTLFHRLKVAGFLSLYAFFGLSSSFADDTEIFFVNNNKTAQIPNVLFIVDTSGSMRSTVAGTDETRLAVVQDALIEILDSVDNINVGLSRFSVPGGPILYPVTYIDKPIDPEVVAPISEGDNDIEEYTNGSGVLLDGVILNLDADNTIGLRFDDLLIPQGAVITEATLSLTALDNHGGTVVYEIAAEASDNAAAYGNASDEVTGRSYTASRVNWTPGAWVADETYASPDLSPLVQEVVDRTGWCGGNALAFQIKHLSGDQRTAYTYNRDSSVAATLRVKYSSTLPAGASGCIRQTIVSQISQGNDDFEFTPGLSNGGNQLNMQSGNDVGLRFRELRVPQGASILSAKLTFTSCKSQNKSAQMTIYGINLDEAPSDNSNFYSAAKTSGTNWAPGAWDDGKKYDTVDISSEIQQIVNRSGWTQGNDLGLFIKGKNKERCGKTYNNSASQAPVLTLTYQGTFTPGVLTVREELKNTVRGFKASGWTPIADMMAEAGRYYRGEGVLYGDVRGNPARSDNRVSHPGTYTGGTLVREPGCTDANPDSSDCTSEHIDGSPIYVSPIVEECQSNHIVFLSDGEPTWMDGATRTIFNQWTGETCDNSPGNGNNGRGADCAVKIASFLGNEKNSDPKYDQSPLPGKQFIRTHTIGFELDSKVLEDMAKPST
jgi:type IV pilus assembly protein PilY1